MKSLNRKGQGLIEACLIAPVVVAVLTALVLLSFRSFIYYYADFQLYEAMICTQHTKAVQCETYLRQKLSNVLILGEIQTASVRGRTNDIRGEVTISFKRNLAIKDSSAATLKISKNIPLPLMGRW